MKTSRSHQLRTTTARHLRLFTGFAAVFAFGLPALAANAIVTARQVIQRIQAHVGVQWKSDTVDTFKAGNPDTPVTRE